MGCFLWHPTHPQMTSIPIVSSPDWRRALPWRRPGPAGPHSPGRRRGSRRCSDAGSSASWPGPADTSTPCDLRSGQPGSADPYCSTESWANCWWSAVSPTEAEGRKGAERGHVRLRWANCWLSAVSPTEAEGRKRGREGSRQTEMGELLVVGCVADRG